MAKKPTYKYTIELTAPMSPRLIADVMGMTNNFSPRLLSVTDLQNDQHEQAGKKSATYRTHLEDESVEEMTLLQMIDFYQERVNGSEPDSPAHDAYTWILAVLLRDDTPGNLGMVYSYVKECLIALDTFLALCDRIHKFAEE